jgi:AhpD family alkylhydroperoxidase
MSDHYHDASDLQLLKQMKDLAPQDFTAWLNLNNIVGREDGAIPKKYRELIALAVACTTQCPYCIEAHSKAAKVAGATREEVVEAAFVAAALRAGGAATHGAMALKFFNKD